jgi:hypothetical protein
MNEVKAALVAGKWQFSVFSFQFSATSRRLSAPKNFHRLLKTEN